MSATLLRCFLLGIFTTSAVATGVPGLDTPVSERPVPSRVPFPTCDQLATLMLRDAGLSPAVLTVAGASDEQVEQIVVVTRALCEVNSTEYSTMWATLQETRGRIQLLQAKVSRGHASSGEVAELASARGALATLEDARAAAREAIRTAVSQALTDEQEAMLWNVCDARTVEAPIVFKVVGRTEAEWVELRNQLSEQRTLARRGVEAEGPEAEAEVELARILFETRLADVTQVWNAALRE